MSETTENEIAKRASQDAIAGLAELLDAGDPKAGLQVIAENFLANSQFDRLFEVRKLQSRLRLGVPLVYTSRPANLDEQVQRELEKDLALAALDCGQKLAAHGDIAGAWNYLRAVDDNAAVRKALESAPLDEENTHAAIDICLNHQAHPEFGMYLAVQKLGTCSSITLFDSVHAMLGDDDLLQAAAVLVRHLYDEISAVAAERLSQPAGTSLADLMEKNRTAVSHSSPHADPSHLASILRIGRTQTSQEVLEMLLTLSMYAGLLPESLQYPGDVPFQKLSTSHQIWYSALLGQNTGEADAHFCADFEQYGISPDRIVALEYGVLLLWNTGRYAEAARLATDPQAPGQFDYGAANIAPHLVALASKPDSAPIIAAHYAQTSDVLGFALARLSQTGHP